MHLAGLVLVGAVMLSAAGPVAAHSLNHCAPGRVTAFAYGFAGLKAYIGQPMGTPSTCAYPDPNGTEDAHQETTGLALWRKSTNIPRLRTLFTTGRLRPPDGLPGPRAASILLTPKETPLDCSLIVHDPGLPMHSTTFENCPGGDFALDLHDVSGYMFANVFIRESFGTSVELVNLGKPVVRPMDAGALAGGALLIQRDADDMFTDDCEIPRRGRNPLVPPDES